MYHFSKGAYTMLKKLSVLFAALALVMVFTACEEDTTDPTTEEPTPTPISGLAANSINDSTVALKWTASTSETHELFDGYYLNMTDDQGTVYVEQKVDPLTEGQALNVSGLPGQAEVTFSVTVRFTNDSVSAPVTIKWATADRFTEDFYFETLKVYETASSFGSGFDMYNADEEGPITLKVGSGADWDLGLKTTDGMVFGSAEAVGYTTVDPDATTEICKEVVYAESLDAVFDTEALSMKNFEVGVVNLDEMSGSFVMVVRRQNPATDGYNYAKVLVKYANGGYLQGEADNRYIELELSYQLEEDLPYARIK